MDVIAAYRDVGSYRGAAAICGTTHKTVKRIIEAHESSTVGQGSERVPRAGNYDEVTDLVAERVRKSQGRISAKRLLPDARVAGYEGSPRNFRRQVAEAKQQWRLAQQRAGGRRPGATGSNATSAGVVTGRDAGDRLGRGTLRGSCRARVLRGPGVVEVPL